MILAFSGIANAQVCGQLFRYDSELPLVEVYFKNSELKVESDFDGHFELPYSTESKNKDLILSLGYMIIEIQNIDLNKDKLDLGKIILPIFKDISIEEFEQLSDFDKENCKPVFHWTQLIGYYNTNKLEEKFILLNCQQKITEFDFNQVTKKIIINWNVIEKCG